MTTHQLAKLLLERPDVKIWGDSVGQGAGEREDELLYGVVYEKTTEGEEIASFEFCDPCIQLQDWLKHRQVTDQFWVKP